LIFWIGRLPTRCTITTATITRTITITAFTITITITMSITITITITVTQDVARIEGLERGHRFVIVPWFDFSK
jgi:hypothetical protein